MCLKHVKYEKSTTFNKNITIIVFYHCATTRDQLVEFWDDNVFPFLLLCLLMGKPLPTFPFEILPI